MPEKASGHCIPVWIAVYSTRLVEDWLGIRVVIVVKDRIMGRALAALAVVFAVWAIADFPRWTVDDAYISYRYAANLANHGEFTWNPGDDPVEGYTGVLLPALLALAIRAGAGPDSTSKLLGLAAFAACGVFLFTLCRRLGAREPVAWVAFSLYCSAPILYTHAFGGLETMLFTALLTASLYVLAVATDSPARRSRECLLFALLLLAALARPEGVVLATAATVALLAARLAESPRACAGTAVRCLAILIVPGIVYFSWRWDYYGQLMPNTYYAKGQRRVYAEPFRLFAAFAVEYLFLPACASGLVLARGWYASRRGSPATPLQKNNERRLIVTIAAITIGVVLAQYARTALIMNFSHRFFVPLFPLFLLLFAVAGETGLSLDNGASRKRGSVLACAGLLLVLQVVWQVRTLKEERMFAASTMRLIADEHVRVAEFLKQRLDPGATIVVVVDAGAIPYFSGFRTIDFGGLNDEFLSKRIFNKLTQEQLVDYFHSHDAAALVFTSSEWDRLAPPDAVPYASDPRFGQYELAARFSSDAAPGYYQFVYLKRAP